MSNGQQPSLDLFWRTVSGFQYSAALKAAVELDLFTAIDNGNDTAEAAASTANADPRGVRIVLDALTVLGFMTKDGDRYHLTADSAAFLSHNSRMYVASAVEFLLSPLHRLGFDDFTNAVKQGGSTVKGEGSLDPESPMWVTFARAMMPLMYLPAEMIAEHIDFDTQKSLKVLDIAAGHGIFGIKVAQRFPNSEVYALDWQNVLTVATENAEEFGVADRHHLITGNAFDVEFGGGYDVVLLTNFLHHFDVETCEKLLRKIVASMSSDGKLMTLEFVPNDDRISPPPAALFSLIMLAGTPAGDAYTYRELRQMIENSGLHHNQIIPLEPTPESLIISSK
jgi:ubiquinone/menaquinone biosynthesis C-methylase UbiE